MITSFLTRKAQSVILVILFAGLLLSGCSGAPATAAPTAPPAPTSTNPPEPTATPAPTSTATQVPSPTVLPTATVNAAATAAANKTATMEAAVQAVAEYVKPDLLDFGIDPKAGHVAWISEDDVRLEATAYQEEKAYTLDRTVGSVSDFVLKTRVSWNSSGGLAGCGIAFRADKDLVDGAHYHFYIMRLQFHPFWDFEYHDQNQWKATFTSTTKMVSTSHLKDDKNSTNTIALVARGKEFTPYLNGVKQTPGTHDKLTDGLISLLAWQDSGKTTCKYMDTWVWVFDE